MASRQMEGYTVNTPVYEGPLDLLLQLIEHAELDITRLALAQVTDQYLAYMHQLEEQAAEEVSAFLVIAAKLLQIKSEALLPRPPVRESDEEDPGEALAHQLIAYKRYREIANQLADREALGLHTYLRLAPPPKVEGVFDLSEVGLADLVDAAQTIFDAALKPSLSTVVTAPKVTIREKIALIRRILRDKQKTTFGALLEGRRSRLDIVVTFLAMLELVKRHLLNVQQESLFAEISLEQNETWDEAEEFDLEFGE